MISETSMEFKKDSGSLLEDSGRLYTRTQIGIHVVRILKDMQSRDKSLRHRQIANILGIAPCEVSLLMNEHFSNFGTDRLLRFFRRLGKKVTIKISFHREGEPYQEVLR